jgi:hypothetical protein
VDLTEPSTSISASPSERADLARSFFHAAYYALSNIISGDEGGDNEYSLRETAGAFGDLGTLIPFVVGYVTINGSIRKACYSASGSSRSETRCAPLTLPSWSTLAA